MNNTSSTTGRLDTHKKPPYPSPSKPPQPKQAKAMTIAAGFQCDEGFVLCADRLMSHGTENDFGSFAHYEKKVFALEYIDFGVAVCGAGNNGLLINSFSQALFQKIQDNDDLDVLAVKEVTEVTLEELADKLGKPPEVSLLIASVKNDKTSFFRSDGLVVRKAGTYEILGIGELSLSHYLIDSIFKPSLKLRQVIALAVSVVYAAKKYCPQYCGGQTDIYVIPNDYGWDTIPLNEGKINQLEAVLAQRIPKSVAMLVDEVAEAITL